MAIFLRMWAIYATPRTPDACQLKVRSLVHHRLDKRRYGFPGPVRPAGVRSDVCAPLFLAIEAGLIHRNGGYSGQGDARVSVRKLGGKG